MAQQPDFTSLWKNVDEKREQGLPKSALEQVNKILTLAKKQQVDDQLIKATATKAQLLNELDETDWITGIREMEAALAQAKTPTKQIIHSYVADAYWQYVQDRQYELYNRTNTSQDPGEDPENWSLQNFYDRIWFHYSSSLQEKSISQNTALRKYQGIIEFPKQPNHLRPTLFDLLAQKALAFTKDETLKVTKPNFSFALNSPEAFASASEFADWEIVTKDSGSQVYRSIRIFQELIQLHRHSVNRDAFLDVDIARLQYVNTQSELPNKTNLYQQALQLVYDQNQHEAVAMQAGYLLAEAWIEEGETFEKGISNPEMEGLLAKAKKLLEEIYARWPNSQAGIEAFNRIQQLIQPSVQLTLENVQIPGLPFRALISFQNVATVHCKILPYDPTLFDNNGYLSDEEFWTKLSKLVPLKTWTQELPTLHDLRMHRVEVKIDQLPVGRYLLAISTGPHFELYKQSNSVAGFYVSNLSSIRNENTVFVLNRQTGSPISPATVNFWHRYYDYGSRIWKEKLFQVGKTDKEGKVIMPDHKSDLPEAETMIELITTNDRLFLKDRIYRTYEYGEHLKDSQDTASAANAYYEIFTDRGLYRPGQMVYFKAIGLTKRSNNHPILFIPEKVTAELLDANYQKVSSVEYKPNEFGSIHGNFKLPTRGLAGLFFIQIKFGNSQSSQKSIRVEEYKRPKFEVTLHKTSQAYELGDEIALSGTATAYAGNAIDGAQVSYTVTRSSRLPYPWLYDRRLIDPFPNNTMQIAIGSTQTDAQGNFKVHFSAIPDASIAKSLQPIFIYEIEAQVTDRNGETREVSSQIQLGYVSLFLKTQMENNGLFETNDPVSCNVTAENAQGLSQPAAIKIQVFKLQAPNRFIRKRLWQTPDTTLMSAAEFMTHFPADPYLNEDDWKNWPIDKLEKEIQVGLDSTGKVTFGKLSAGVYQVVFVSQDKHQKPVVQKEYVQVYDIKQNLFPHPLAVIDVPLAASYQPGQTARVNYGVAFKPEFVIEEVKKAMGSSLRTITTGHKLGTTGFTIEETNRGGFTVGRTFVFQNRTYSSQWQIQVPWTNKRLKVSLKTFRNPLLPGSTEKWTIHISSPNKDKVLAELLASMYDASLDAIEPFAWQTVFPWVENNFNITWHSGQNFTTAEARVSSPILESKNYEGGYAHLMQFGFGNYHNRYLMMRTPSVQSNAEVRLSDVGGKAAGKLQGDTTNTNRSAIQNRNQNIPQPRKNFNETAFFFPTLNTDEQGDVTLSFNTPESLTRWKLQMFAHTQFLELAQHTEAVITQKDLMVQPFAPRFVRNGDLFEFTAKIVNMTDREIGGIASFKLWASTTNKQVDSLFRNHSPVQSFTIPPKQSIQVRFPIQVPLNFNDALTYQVIAESGNHTDGEEMTIPVLSNRLLVTESLPVYLRNAGSKKIIWPALLQSGQSSSLQSQSLTFEYSANPVWYAVQALPYLSTNGNESAEGKWNQYYANAVAAFLVQRMPSIKTAFSKWKQSDTSQILSNLHKNPELKSALLAETPWVLAAESESQQKERIAQLFDASRIETDLSTQLDKLETFQSVNGGFVWVHGAPEDRYMTQYIVTNMGKLRSMQAIPLHQQERVLTMAKKAIAYLDNRLLEDYQFLLSKKADLKAQSIDNFQAQYLYMRSFFNDVSITPTVKKAYTYYFNLAKNQWQKLPLQSQAMTALTMQRGGQKTMAKKILASLTQRSQNNPEMGMYWKSMTGGRYWFQASVESQAVLLEAYAEIEGNASQLNDLKTWLLRNKQTNHWPTSKATADAIYALLMNGSNWIESHQTVTMEAGDWQEIVTNNHQEPGYVKVTLPGDDVKPEMGQIKLSVQTTDNKANSKSLTSWGAFYWQYFEDLSKIKSASTGLVLNKEIMVQTQTDQGTVLKPVKNTILKVGDKIVIRLQIKTDRDLEYVHLKDLRAANLEPVNQISGFRFLGGIGYYQSPQDLSMQFFFPRLAKGVYVLEYPVMITHAGEFQSGIATLQCMYAPEFNSHSSGASLQVAN